MPHRPEEIVQLGRLAPLHHGHGLITEHALRKSRARKPVVMISSSNIFVGKPPKNLKEKELMLRTPFTAEEREEMVRRVFGHTVEVLHLPDLEPDPTKHGTSADTPWLKQIALLEQERGTRFVFAGGAPEDLHSLSRAFPTEVLVDRRGLGKGISATQARKLLQDGRVTDLEAIMDPRVIPLAMECFHRNIQIIHGSEA